MGTPKGSLRLLSFHFWQLTHGDLTSFPLTASSIGKFILLCVAQQSTVSFDTHNGQLSVQSWTMQHWNNKLASLAAQLKIVQKVHWRAVVGSTDLLGMSKKSKRCCCKHALR